MCGLAGFSGFMPADPNKMRILLMENQERGSHSTGIYGKKLMRKAEPAKEFVKDPNFSFIAKSHIVVAHTRYSTGAAKTKENAHPFVHRVQNGKSLVDNIIGTHNGWVVNEYEMEEKVEGFKRASVDSNSIYTLMNMIDTMAPKQKKAVLKNLGIDSELKVFSLFEGAMALAFIKNNRLYLYRRDSRPLFIGVAKEGIYYSSLKDSLERIGIPDNKVYQVKSNRLVTIRGSKIERIDVISEPRVNITANCSTYSWEAGVDKKLVEELTGKKQYAVTHNATSTTYTATKRNTTRTPGQQALELPATLDNPRKIITIEQAKREPRQVYGRTLLLPGESELRDIPMALSRGIAKHSLRRPTIDSLKSINGEFKKGFWPNEMSAVISYPLFFNWIEGNGIVKDTMSSLLYIQLKGFRDGQADFFYTRDDAFIIAEIEDAYSGEKLHALSGIDSQQGFFWLDKSLLHKNVEHFSLRLTIAFAKVPGFIMRTDVKIPADAHIRLRAYIDVDKLMDHTTMMNSFSNKESYEAIHKRLNMPIGDTADKVIAESIHYNRTVLTGRKLEIEKKPDDCWVSPKTFISDRHDKVKKKLQLEQSQSDKSRANTTSGGSNGRGCSIERNPYSRLDEVISVMEEDKAKKEAKIMKDKEEIQKLIEEVESSIKDVSEFLHKEASGIQKKNHNWEHPLVSEFSEDVQSSCRALNELRVKLSKVKEIAKEYSFIPF